MVMKQKKEKEKEIEISPSADTIINEKKYNYIKLV